MEINLGQYVNMIRKYLWLFVLCSLLFTIPTAIYSSRNYVPIYQASTKLIVNKTLQPDLTATGPDKEQIDFGAIGTNIQLINTYKEIIKTPAIMDKVAQRYPDLELTSEQLISKINVSDVNETQVMSIVANDTSYEKAAKITTYVSRVFETELPKIMKVDNVAILSGAKLDDSPMPINQQSNRMIILSFAASLVLSTGIMLLLESLDNTIKTDAHIREILGTSTLALIPKTRKKLIRSPKKVTTPKKESEAAVYATISD
ncbi:YveK family protein [Cohnella kolymensis]|uniref:YveK family protein n=1 Tax=Cohnella kolymensis TaxID=1590652 RepID=UPI000697CB8F|nr:Wzz/FepE/Etk N-terminal domain-containing protein [Cohnella kolymensis]